MPELIARAIHLLLAWRGESQRAREAAALAQMPRRARADLHSLYVAPPPDASTSGPAREREIDLLPKGRELRRRHRLVPYER